MTLSAIPSRSDLPAALHANPINPRPDAALSPSGQRANALNALLNSGPNNAREPKRPEKPNGVLADTTAQEQAINELAPHINQASVERMIRHPGSLTATRIFENAQRALTAGTIDAVLRGPNAQACKTTLTTLETHLNKDSIDAARTALETEQIDAYQRYVDASLFDLKYRLLTTAPSSRFDLIRSFANEKPKTLANIEDYLSDVGARAASLCDIATAVRKVNEPLQYALPDEWERRRSDTDQGGQPNLYRYLTTGESTLESPSEIRDFKHGTDKLDVAGIAKQLAKKLQWVNQLSGASGEMLLRYSPTNDASVLLISGEKDEPAFVAKIFGKFKQTDLIS
ncbi:M10 family metallopeptidase C-terminal domain-containing protein [Pseudomonas kairouanensis]|nr:M10 family metallopeptidase C-terminal domain-containing protein [Pseudomonas kairouanensis]